MKEENNGPCAPSVTVKSPGECSQKELDDFVAFVLAGGEVASRGLRRRVEGARSLAFLREGECLLGVAGLKHPEPQHRDSVQKSAEFPLPQDSFPFELGWIFILPSARGRKLSLPLCKEVVKAANKGGIYATSRAGNLPMHATLERIGFKHVGQEWPSGQNEGNLFLFARYPADG